MTLIADKPHNDLPLLPPRKDAWETLVVYRKLADVRAALAELKGRAPVIPKRKMTIALLFPFLVQSAGVMHPASASPHFLAPFFTSLVQKRKWMHFSGAFICYRVSMRPMR